MTIQDKKGRGTLSSSDEPSRPLYEVDYHIHIEENKEPPTSAVEVRSIKWADVKLRGQIQDGKYVLTDQDGQQHLITCTNSGHGWAYHGLFVSTAN
jgi:hypothetical protein